MTKENYLTFWLRNIGCWVGNIIVMPIKGFSMFPYVVSKHPDKDLPQAIADSVDYFYTYDPKYVGGFVINAFLGIAGVLRSPGNLRFHKPYQLETVIETSLSSLYPPVQYYCWKFFSYTLFTNTTYCGNTNGEYKVRDLLLDIGCVVATVVFLKYGAAKLFSKIKTGYQSYMNRRRHKRVVSDIQNNSQRLMHMNYSFSRRNANMSRRLTLMMLMEENPHMKTPSNIEAVRGI